MDEMNPARLSTELSALLPRGALAAELYGSPDAALLLSAEAEQLGRAVPSRIAEFTAGRLCARRVLAALDIEGFPVRRAADRRPIWPAGIVGSITHTGGYCVAALARQSEVRSLGVDCEPVGSVKAELFVKICTPLEIAWLETLAVRDRSSAATLIFCAKEAFYKCQYILVGEALGFRDAEIEIDDWAATSGQFTVRFTRQIAFCAHASTLVGRYRQQRGFLTAALALSADQ